MGQECKISVSQDLESLVLDQESRFDEIVGISRDCNKDHARNATILYKRRQTYC